MTTQLPASKLDRDVTKILEGWKLAEAKPAPATLFLGAGASAAFDYPTTKQFIERLQANLSGKEKELLLAFTQVPEIKDVEFVLEILDQVVELENPFLKYLELHKVQIPIGPTFHGYMTTGWKEFKELASSLRTMIHNELFRQYQFDPKKTADVRKLLNETLKAVSKGTNITHVFTTNYDSVVEESLSGSKEYLYVDGFVPSPNQAAVWDGNFALPTGGLLRNVVYLYKLHGSLTWRIDKNSGSIVRLETEEKASGYSLKYGENALLYPASKSPPIAEPYGSLYGCFSQRLNSANVCVVIGFSFRDPFINTVFVDYLRCEGNYIVIVSPTADECARNLLRPLENSRLIQQVISLNNRYGEPYTTSLISATVEKLVKRSEQQSNNIPV